MDWVNVMDWANKNTYFPIRQTFPTPDEYALYKDNSATGSGMHSTPKHLWVCRN